MLWLLVIAITGGLLFVIFHKPSLNVGGLSTHLPPPPAPPSDRRGPDPRP